MFTDGSMLEYDVVVLGSGPGGQKAAIAAAKLGKTLAVVERGKPCWSSAIPKSSMPCGRTCATWR
jgi:NAD(P) transhydrogenase